MKFLIYSLFLMMFLSGIFVQNGYAENISNQTITIHVDNEPHPREIPMWFGKVLEMYESDKIEYHTLINVLKYMLDNQI